MEIIIQPPLLGTGMAGSYKNVYCDTKGILHPTPFAMPREGMWYFDGQVFYQRKGGL